MPEFVKRPSSGRMPPSLVAIVDAYAHVARPILLEYLPRRSCIASAHTTAVALRLFGIDVAPVPVYFCLSIPALNVAYVSGMDQETRVKVISECKEFTQLDSDKDTWDGHVILTRGTEFLIDPSFDQAFASIAEGGVADVPVEPFTLVLPLDGKEFGTSSLAQISMRSSPPHEHLIEVRYCGTEDYSFIQTPAWQDEAIAVIANRIADRMLERLL